MFLHVDPTDTVHNVKVKIEDLMRKEPNCQQLYKDGVELDGKRTMVDLKIENNDVLVLALKRDGESPLSSSAPQNKMLQVVCFIIVSIIYQ